MIDEPEVRAFAEQFRAFLKAIEESVPAPEPTRLHQRVTDHLGGDPTEQPVTTEGFAAYDLANVQAAMDAYLAGDGVSVDLIGLVGSGRDHHNLADLMNNARKQAQFDIGTVDYTTVTVGVGRERACVSFGLYLISDGDKRLAVLMRLSNYRGGALETLIEVMGGGAEGGQTFLHRIREEIIRHHICRGQVLSFEPWEYGAGMGPLRFHERPSVEAADVVLPAGTLEAVHRQILGVAEHRERLLAAGHHLKRGVVLYGPPGTGKTHTVRHLIGAQREATVIVLTGLGVQYIREACNLARVLPPALIVLEDVDLVAEERTTSYSNPLLFQLLNEMDGVAGDADIAFLLTTNRLDLVEPALAQRPGRVDLVVEVPLPDAPGRRRLLSLYGVSAHLEADEVESVVTKTEGTTGSFFAELSRRAELLAATAGDALVGMKHVTAALDELARSREAAASSGRPQSPPAASTPYV
ncbi:ATP-binding protein [Actinoplanes sp. NBRC 103695]|uniref:AAA family ATPase n=1 Tax=Actinoplanes sp. NBRC 103695 TaxID=3032202 RepID=UPI0024A2F625|nr:ATP-binding protein [Actinoplanes sp. NBRC 103695]GLZ01674.1 ATPase [Actinoplanes sp. NBRC 103695]